MFRRFVKRSKHGTILLILALIFTVSVAPGALALNYNGDGTPGTGNKSLDFMGYQYVTADSIYLFFNKTIATADINAGQFHVYNHGTTTDAATVSLGTINSGTGYSGCSDTGLNKGTRIPLNLSTSLTPDTLYDVNIKGALLLSAETPAGISLSNYHGRNDFTFTLRTPDSGGNYTTGDDLHYTYSEVETDSVTSYESNLVVVFDRPLKSSEESNYLSSLSANFKKGEGTPVVVTQDSSIDANAVAGAECYTPHANDANNTFFFPEGVNGITYTCYNRDASHQHYSLTLPTFTDVDDNVFTTPDTLNFSTVSADYPGWLNQTLTVDTGTTTDTLDVSWDVGTVTPVVDSGAGEGFYVYYLERASSDTEALTGNFQLSDATPTYSAGTWSATVHITGSSGKTYFIRVVPYNSNGSVGFSQWGKGTAY